MLSINSIEDICSLALVKNGAKTITDINSITDAHSILMKTLYAPALEMLLTETYWMFATKRINAVQVGGSTVHVNDLTAWATNTGYLVGATPKIYIDPDNWVYYCIKSHAYWESGNQYKVGDYVTYLTNVYICTQDNLSTTSILPTDILYWDFFGTSADTNPKTGADTAIFWQELTEDPESSGIYLIDIVSNVWSTWGLDQIYLVPDDMVRVIGWSVPSATVRQEGQYYLTDSTALGLLYNFFNEVVLTYPAHFVQTFVDKLQADSCQKLTGSKSKSEKLFEYWIEESLPKAQAKDGQGQSTITVKKDAWTNARYNGVAITGTREVRYR